MFSTLLTMASPASFCCAAGDAILADRAHTGMFIYNVAHVNALSSSCIVRLDLCP